ncbi:DUF4810 domain-containing protein [Betaproteobacteria bacterium]|nr:DUF4810 domain-containing protein [Betaproteobacteria bacterium]GHU13391.1 DUF4810 domain-containing protein [Betaproteobacteria bacterium]GHU13402.1 DUF4810 domain-containing protein [Betaproteobacteria bacterium]
MQNRCRFLPALVLAALVSACASGPGSQPLYRWGSYEAQVYAQLKGESPEAQIEALERDIEIINASGKLAPPGFYAHLGMLYAETGHDDKAIASFETEKTRFPESATFMDFLLDKYKK